MKQLLILILLYTAACSNSVKDEETKEVDTSVALVTDTIVFIDTPEIVRDSQKVIIKEFFTDLLKAQKCSKCMIVRSPDANLLAQLEMVKPEEVNNSATPLFTKKAKWTIDEVIRVKKELKSNGIKEWERDYFPAFVRFDTTSFSNCLIEEKRECEVSLKQFQWAYFKDEMSVEYYTYSQPVFTSDGQWALVSLEERCFGECGYGSLVICKKENEHWVIVDELNMWIG